MPLPEKFLTVDRLKAIVFQLQVMKYPYESTKQCFVLFCFVLFFCERSTQDILFVYACYRFKSRPDHSGDLSSVIPNSTLPRFVDTVSQLSSSVFTVVFIRSIFVHRSARLDAGLTCVDVTKSPVKSKYRAVFK